MKEILFREQTLFAVFFKRRNSYIEFDKLLFDFLVITIENDLRVKFVFQIQRIYKIIRLRFLEKKEKKKTNKQNNKIQIWQWVQRFLLIDPKLPNYWIRWLHLCQRPCECVCICILFSLLISWPFHLFIIIIINYSHFWTISNNAAARALIFFWNSFQFIVVYLIYLFTY